MLKFKNYFYLKELFDNDLGGNSMYCYLPRTNIQSSNLDESEDSGEHILHDLLINHYRPDKLSDPDKKAIRSYTHNNSEDINSQLWDHFKGTHKGKLYSDVPKLDKIIGSHFAPKTFHVYSSTRHDPRVLKDSNNIVHHPAYLSTSHRKTVALTRDVNSHYDNKTGDNHLHIVHFDIPENYPSMYVAHHSTAKFLGERETILPRGLNLKHLNTETKTLRGYDEYNNRPNFTHYHYHHMEIVK